MKTLFMLTSVIALLFLAAPNKIDAQEKKPITNADIVNMVKAAVPESNIVKAIQQSITNFDTSPQGLIELNKQGVSSKIIDAMQQAGAPTTPTQPTPKRPANNPRSNRQFPANALGQSVVILIDAEGRTEMKHSSPEGGRFNIGVMDVVNPLGSTKIKAVFKGNHAELRTKTTPAAFEGSIPNNVNPTDQVALVRLTQKKDTREIETGRYGVLSGNRTKSNQKDIVPITIEEIKEQNASRSTSKQYNIKPVNPLPPGEYAIVVGGVYYDLGVDSVK